MPDVFETLKIEHRLILEGLRRVERAEPNLRATAFAEIRPLLADHARREQEDLYPLLAGLAEVQDELREALADHREMEGILAAMAALDPRGAGWLGKLYRLHALLDRHCRWEEERLIARARALALPARSETVRPH